MLLVVSTMIASRSHLQLRYYKEARPTISQLGVLVVNTFPHRFFRLKGTREDIKYYRFDPSPFSLFLISLHKYEERQDVGCGS